MPDVAAALLILLLTLCAFKAMGLFYLVVIGLADYPFEFPEKTNKPAPPDPMDAVRRSIVADIKASRV